MTEKNEIIISYFYKILSFFVIVYGVIGMLFYLFTLFFLLFLGKSPAISGYNSFHYDAFVFLLIVFLLLYIGVMVVGVLLLKLHSNAITGYFLILLMYYSINIWITGSINFLFLFLLIIYGFLLLFFYKKITSIVIE